MARSAMVLRERLTGDCKVSQELVSIVGLDEICDLDIWKFCPDVGRDFEAFELAECSRLLERFVVSEAFLGNRGRHGDFVGGDRGMKNSIEPPSQLYTMVRHNSKAGLRARSDRTYQ